MNEPSGVLISFRKIGNAICMLSLSGSLSRVLRLCIAPWLSGGCSYFAGLDLSTTSFPCQSCYV